MTVAEGQDAPGFDLPADGGGRIRLADFAGRPVVLCFYPRDDTPGCTRAISDETEAHRTRTSFRSSEEIALLQ
ncbi:MAG TPA: redoxin domain-containing protein [Geminicoccaceae bacterium]